MKTSTMLILGAVAIGGVWYLTRSGGAPASTDTGGGAPAPRSSGNPLGGTLDAVGDFLQRFGLAGPSPQERARGPQGRTAESLPTRTTLDPQASTVFLYPSADRPSGRYFAGANNAT